jgi:hypothetical protein
MMTIPEQDDALVVGFISELSNETRCNQQTVPAKWHLLAGTCGPLGIRNMACPYLFAY